MPRGDKSGYTAKQKRRAERSAHPERALRPATESAVARLLQGLVNGFEHAALRRERLLSGAGARLRRAPRAAPGPKPPGQVAA